MQNLLSISATAGYYIRTFTPKKKKNKKITQEIST